jgi:tRNA 2-selenouridine synthase SelU
VSKFTAEDGRLIKSIVAALSIKRIPDTEIVAKVKRQTDKKITRLTLYNVRQRIKKDSYHCSKAMREGQFEYIHEFRERINEKIWLQKKPR